MRAPSASAGRDAHFLVRQLGVAQRFRTLFDDGHPLVSAVLIARLEDDLAAANAEVTALREQLRDI